jgi:hypothetical protein
VPIARLKKTARFLGRFGLDARFLRSGDQHRCVKHLSLGPQQGRDQFVYSVANEPGRFDFDVSEWLGKVDVRGFVRNAVDAFPKLIARGPQQFVLLELSNRQRR